LPSTTHFAQSGRSVRVVALLKQTNVKIKFSNSYEQFQQEQISHDEIMRQNEQEVGVHLNSLQVTQEGDTCDIDYKKVFATQFLFCQYNIFRA
jgi:hypothetical protein